MRKTSQDGGDSTSITSGFENEIKKSGGGLIKTKRNSIKKKVQNFSHESDDTVNEPLLQMEKIESANRSAKFLLSKSKADSVSDKESSIHSDKSSDKSSVTKAVSPVGPAITSSFVSGTLHNHMNTNVFGGHDGSKTIIPVKSPILVEINASKSSGHSPAPLIFTTARIHTDSKTKNMEPVHVTPIPILSTIEGNIVKAGVTTHYGQTATTTAITSTNVMKQGTSQLTNVQHIDTSHTTSSGIGKSDSHKSSNSSSNMVNKLSGALDSRSVPSIESEANFLRNSFETKNISATLSSIPGNNDIEKSSKIRSPTQEVKIKTENNQKFSTQPYSLNRFAENVQTQEKKPDMNKNVDTGSTLSLKKSTTISHPSTSKHLKEVVKKEDSHKIISTSSVTGKHLQRQKNTDVDVREFDAREKKDYEDLINNVASTSQPQSTVKKCVDQSKTINNATTSSNTNATNVLNKSTVDKTNIITDAVKQSPTEAKTMQSSVGAKSETLVEKKSKMASVGKPVIEKPLTMTQNITPKPIVTSVPKTMVKSANGSITLEVTSNLKTGAAPKQPLATTVVSRSISESQDILSSSLDKPCKQLTSTTKLGTPATAGPSTSSTTDPKIAKLPQDSVVSPENAISKSTSPLMQSSSSNTRVQTAISSKNAKSESITPLIHSISPSTKVPSAHSAKNDKSESITPVIQSSSSSTKVQSATSSKNVKSESIISVTPSSSSSTKIQSATSSKNAKSESIISVTPSSSSSTKVQSVISSKNVKSDSITPVTQSSSSTSKVQCAISTKNAKSESITPVTQSSSSNTKSQSVISSKTAKSESMTPVIQSSSSSTTVLPAIGSKNAKPKGISPEMQSSSSNIKVQSSTKVSPTSISATPNVKSSTSAKTTSLASKQISSKATLPKDGKT